MSICAAKMGVGTLLLLGMGASGCRMHVQNHTTGGKDNGIVDIHVDAKDENGSVSFKIKGNIGGTTVTETVKQTYNAAKVQNIQITEGEGSIAIEAAPDGNEEISISAVKHINGEKSEASLKPLLKSIKPMVKLNKGTLTLYTERDTDALKAQKLGGWIDYTIRVPKRLNAFLQTASGDIKASGLAGKLTAETASGAMELSDLRGELHAKASSGDITLNGADIVGALELTTTSGAINVEEARGTPTVTLTASSGNISFDGNAKELMLETTSGAIEATLTEGSSPSEISAKSTSGNVTFSVPDSLKARLSLNTKSGSISIEGENNHSQTNSKTMETTLGGGGAPFRVETTSGSITIKTP